MISFSQLMESLGNGSVNESIIKKPLSRYQILKNHGKRRFLWKSSRPGYRIVHDPRTHRPKEVKISQQLKREFKLAAKKRKRNPAFKRHLKQGRMKAKRLNIKRKRH